MSEALCCPRCGKILSLDAPQGLCPACVLEQGLADAGTLSPQGPMQGPMQAETETMPPGPSLASSGIATSSDAGSLSNAAASVPGYEIMAELGRGGMGVVYKARQMKLQRLVALKMILAGGHASAADLARFKTEAEAIARLQHPNIVQVFEVGEHDGKAFFSLEYCDGGSLAQKLKGTPLPPREAAAVVETLARAMAAAHEKGIIHRDLKPANVLLASGVASAPRESSRGADATPLGESLKITDFGLAKKLDDVGQTQSGAIMGTPSYMAPEQASGKTRELGPATDVYALGAILYECLTGRPPFKAATPLDTILQVVSDEPAPPRQLQSKLPRDLETICLKCLQKDPVKRYPTAAALAEDLRRWRAGEPIQARPAGIGERLVKWVRRRPAAAALVGVSLLAAVLLAGVGVYFLDRLAGERNDALEARRQADEEKGKAQKSADKERIARESAQREQKNADAARRLAEEQRDRVEWLGYAGTLVHAEQACQDGNTARGRALLEDCRWDLRGWEYRYLTAAANRGQQTLTGHSCGINCLALSPDGRHLVTGSGQAQHVVIGGVPGNPGELLLWDLDNEHKVSRLKGQAKGVACAAFSADGKRFVTVGLDHTPKGEQTYKLWDAATGQTLSTFTGLALSVALSPDGKQVVSTRGDRLLYLWETDNGKRVPILFDEHKEAVTCVAVSPDGKRFVSGSLDRTLKIWDAATGQVVRTLTGHAAPVLCVAISLDGKRIVSGAGRQGQPGEIKLWNAADGEPLSRQGYADEVTCVAVTTDGQRFAGGSADGTLKVWDAQGQQLLAVKGHADRMSGVAFAAANRVITASADGTVRLWDLEKAPGVPTLQGHRGAVRGVAVSADGKRLVSAGADGTRKVWDAEQGKAVGSLGDGRVPITCVAISPDGKHLVSGGDEHALTVWDAKTGRPVRTLAGHQGAPTYVAFTPNGKRIVSAFTSQVAVVLGHTEIKVWDADTGKEVSSLGRQLGAFTCAALSPDGKTIVCGYGNPEAPGKPSAVKVWELDAGKEVRALKGHAGWVTCVAFSRDGKLIVSGSWDGALKLWDAQTGDEVRSFTGHANWISCAAFSFDGKRIVSGSQDPVNPGRPGELKVWHVERGLELLTLKGHGGGISCVAFTPRDRQIVSGSADATLKLWQASNDPEERILRGHRFPVYSVAVSADGSRVVSGGFDSTVRVWDALKGRELVILSGHADRVHWVAISPDGKHVLSSGQDGTLRLWNADTGAELRTFQGDDALREDGRRGRGPLGFSPDGKRFFASGGLKEWDLESGKEIRSLKGTSSLAVSADGKRRVVQDPMLRVLDTHTGDEIISVRAARPAALSPDGKWLAAGSGETSLKIWDLTTGKEVCTLRGHTSHVSCVAFSPDGKHLVSGSFDTTLKVWTVTGQEIATLKGHSSWIQSVAISADGRRIVSGGWDNSVRIWDLLAGP